MAFDLDLFMGLKFSFFLKNGFLLFSSPEPKSYRMVVEPVRLCVCVFMCVLTLSNVNISEAKGPNIIFYMKHYWGGVKAVVGFGPDRIRTLLSMSTNSSHRLIMWKILLTL